MEVAEIALIIDEVLKKKAFPGPLYYRFSWDKLVCLVPDETHLSDLHKYQGRGVKTVYVPLKFLRKVHDSELSFAGILYGPKQMISTEQRRQLTLLMTEGLQRLEKIGVFIPKKRQLLADLRALLVLLSSDRVLAVPILELMDLSPSLLRHSFEVAILSQVLFESTGPETRTAKRLDALLLGLTHDLGKAQLPADIRSKNPSQLTNSETLILRSHSQNLSLMVERNPSVRPEQKELFSNYDLLERKETVLSYDMNRSPWLVIIANRLLESVLPQSHFSSMGSFKEALLGIEFNGLGLPQEIVKSFQDSMGGRWKESA